MRWEAFPVLIPKSFVTFPQILITQFLFLGFFYVLPILVQFEAMVNQQNSTAAALYISEYFFSRQSNYITNSILDRWEQIVEQKHAMYRPSKSIYCFVSNLGGRIRGDTRNSPTQRHKVPERGPNYYVLVALNVCNFFFFDNCSFVFTISQRLSGRIFIL